MSTSVDPFIIPDGLHIENSSNGFLIEHQGDIVIKSATGLSALQQNHNRGLRLRSTNGNIVLELTDAEAQKTPRVSSLEAPNGSISLSSPVQVSSITARTLESSVSLNTESINVEVASLSGSLSAQSINAEQLAVTGNLNSDQLRCSSLSVGGSLSCAAIALGAPNSETQINGITRCDQLHYFGGSLRLLDGIQALSANAEVEVIAQEAAVAISGNSQLKLINARSVTLKDGQHTIKAIQGRDSIEVFGSVLHSDVLMAPEVTLSNGTSGKVMVVETQQLLGNHSVKGCLQLADLEGIIPDTEAFLQQRGLSQEQQFLAQPTAVPQPNAETTLQPTAHSEHSAAAVVPVQATTTTSTASNETSVVNSAAPSLSISLEAVSADESQSDDEITLANPMAEDLQEAVVSIELSEPDVELDLSQIELDSEERFDEAPELGRIGDIERQEHSAELEQGLDDLSIDDESMDAFVDFAESEWTPPPATRNRAPQSSAMDSVTGNISAIVQEYAGEAPSSIQLLKQIHRSGDIEELKENMHSIWDGILKFHQLRNSRLPPRVIRAFNALSMQLNRL